MFQVLLVEDNEISQKTLSQLLNFKDCGVTIAANGKQAVEAFSKRAYDLILMDVQMPEMDGLDATRIIRGLERGTGRRIPIVAITGYALEGDKERCLKAGMDGYLAKPVGMDDLFRVVEEFLEKAPEAALSQ